MKKLFMLAFLATTPCLCFGQLPPLAWSIAKDTLTDNVYHYHKNLAISNSGLSAALNSRNDIDQIDVYELDGSLRYSKSFADDQCWYYQVEFSASDELYLIGTNQPQSQEGSSLRVQKLDAQGNVIWTLHWLDAATEYTGVIRTHLLSDGRLVVCGQFNFYTTGSSNDFYIVCVNPDGQMDWEYVYTSEGSIVDILRNTTIDANDHVYFTGIRQNPDLPVYYNVIAGKLDSAGNLLWTTDLDYSNFNGQSAEAKSVAVDSFGDVLLAANSFTYNLNNVPISIPFIIRLDGATGTMDNMLQVPFEQSAAIEEIAASEDGTYYTNFVANRDSLIYITPEFYYIETHERSLHVMKWNVADEAQWTYSEIAPMPLFAMESYDILYAPDQLLIFNYYDNTNRIISLNLDGSLLNDFVYPNPVTHIGVYQHHLARNEHGVYLLSGSVQESQSSRPYYILLRFNDGVDSVENLMNSAFVVYPNPAKDRATIPHLQATDTVRMMDLSGRVFPIQQIGQSVTWESLSAGIYVLVLVRENRVYTSPMVVE
jgi:Domain of unknown function (DUF5122) beta-propeller/Secretion system C-terminal sorting domain